MSTTARLQTFWSTAGWYLGGAAAIQLVNFLAQPVFALLMEPAEWGVTATYVFWMTVFGLVIGFQAQSALNNVRTTYGEADLPRYIATVLPWYVVPVSVLLAAIAVAPDFWARTLGISAGYLALAVGNGVLFAVSAMAMGYALTLGRRWSYLTLMLCSTLLPLALGLVLVLLMPDDRAFARILGYLAGAAVVAVAVAARASRVRVTRDRALLAFGLAISLPLLVHELLYVVMSQSNRVFLSTLVDSEAAGVFAFAFGIGNIAVVAATAVNSAWTPWYFTHTKSEEHDRVRHTGGQLVLLFGTAIAALSLVSPEALRAITRAAYWDGALVVPVLIVTGHCLLVFNVSANYAIYVRRTPLVLLVSASGCAINVVLNLLLIPRWSIEGAAIASLAAAAWLAVCMTLLSRWMLRAPNLPQAAITASLALVGGALLLELLARDQPLIRFGLAAVLMLATAWVLVPRLLARRRG
jgi:O-antigen/teichoic acid export membrane protein